MQILFDVIDKTSDSRQENALKKHELENLQHAFIAAVAEETSFVWSFKIKKRYKINIL